MSQQVKEVSEDRLMAVGKWTPGPWEVTRKIGVHVGISCVGDFIGDAATFATIAKTHTIANARLIALAPEMAEALRTISEGKGAFNRDPLEHASNVIEEARSLAKSILAKLGA